MNSRTVFMALCVPLLIGGLPAVKAQTAETTQLLLNVEKLSQFREILKQMHQGYRVLKTGYQAVQDIAEGNFSLHRTFLDGLMLVRPGIRNYGRVADIIDYQIRLVKLHHRAVKRLGWTAVLRDQERAYLLRVYRRVTSETLSNLDELMQIITSDQLRMSDEERLAAIDRIYEQVADRFLFLKAFDTDMGLLLRQRSNAKDEWNEIRRWHER